MKPIGAVTQVVRSHCHCESGSNGARHRAGPAWHRLVLFSVSFDTWSQALGCVIEMMVSIQVCVGVASQSPSRQGEGQEERLRASWLLFTLHL